MDPEVSQRFEKIEAILQRREVYGAAMERRFDEAHRKAMKRMDRAEQKADQRTQKADERMDKADQRMDKFEINLEATRKLVEAGIKMVSRMAAETRELKASQKAFLDSLRGVNGNGHKRHRP